MLKITVWLGNKAADKYRLAPLFGRADVGKIPHGHRWDLPRSEFAPDSPLAGAGFEPSVPRPKTILSPGEGAAVMARLAAAKGAPYSGRR